MKWIWNTVCAYGEEPGKLRSLIHDRDKEFVSSANYPEQPGPYPASYPVGTGALSIVVEWPGHKNGHTAPFCSWGWEYMQLYYLHSLIWPHETAELKDNFTFLYNMQVSEVSSHKNSVNYSIWICFLWAVCTQLIPYRHALWLASISEFIMGWSYN